ncbi:MAG: PAS domain S-box protein [Rhodospirillaceae bacterium]|nr:PAS domain S-box protein [Rhodospirillaceae bacterium]
MNQNNPLTDDTEALPEAEPLDPKGFRPSRGPSPGIFLMLAVLASVSALVTWKGYVDIADLGPWSGLVPYIGALLAVLFTLLATWAFGRQSNEDGEARLVFEAQGELGAALMITDSFGHMVYANSAFRQLFNNDVAPKVPRNLRLQSDDYDSREKAERLLAQGAAGGLDHDHIAFQIPGLKGAQLQWWHISVRPMGKSKKQTKAGKGLIVWTGRDVSAERELDAVRRREEGLLSDLLENLPVGFFSVNGAGEMVYANEALCKWLGVTLPEMKQNKLTFADFVIASGSLNQDGEPDLSDDDDEGLHGEVTLQARDGTTFRAYLMQSGREGSDGELLYTRSVLVRDVARRTAATTEGRMDAREIARRLYWLFEEAPVSIVLLDLQGNATDCNRAFQRMLGSHKEDVMGRPFVDRLAKEDRGDVSAQLSKVVMGILRAAHLEVRMPAAGGREVMASLYASRMEDAFGEVTGLVLHFIDTTEHKHLEVQFAQSQKMQAIGQLAGGIAHDFNNLLTAMIGFSDLLLTRHGPEDPSFADIQQIKQNANRATNLVRQLLTFSRKETMEPVIFDPNEALSDLSSMLGRLLESRIELNIESEPELALVRMDRNQFDQVVINLAVNAKDAMPGGGVLTVRTRNLNLVEPMQRGMDLVPAGEYVTLDVIDTGTGIRKEDMGRIFEPFFSTKEVGKGTGLGLSTVYGIMRQVAGFVFVDSAPGEGTTFTLLLPSHTAKGERHPQADDGATDAGKAEKSATPAPGAPETDLTGVGTILLVEDEDAVRMFGSRALKNKGYDVLEAANGEAALDVINSTDARIDLIVTDVVMPGMDGHTLVQFVRQEMPDMKVIFISGYADNVIPGGFGDSDFAFLPKPFSLKDLAAKVKEVLDS